MVGSNEFWEPEGPVVSGVCGKPMFLKAWDGGGIDEGTGRGNELGGGRVVPEEKGEVNPFGWACKTC